MWQYHFMILPKT